jgi:hypothetical protein
VEASFETGREQVGIAPLEAEPDRFSCQSAEIIDDHYNICPDLQRGPDLQRDSATGCD